MGDTASVMESVDEAADRLGISRATMWKVIRVRELQTFRVVGDRRTMVRRADVDHAALPVPLERAKKVAA